MLAQSGTASAPSGTMTIGRFTWCNIHDDTDPSSAAPTAPWPRAPTTTRSASSDAVASADRGRPRHEVAEDRHRPVVDVAGRLVDQVLEPLLGGLARVGEEELVGADRQRRRVPDPRDVDLGAGRAAKSSAHCSAASEFGDPSRPTSIRPSPPGGVVRRHHHGRDLGMCRALIARRSEQQPGEAATAAVADDERASRGPTHRAGPKLHRRGRRSARRADRCGCGTARADCVDVLVGTGVERVDVVRDGDRTGHRMGSVDRRLPRRDEMDRRRPVRRVGDRPVERRAGAGRAVDADDPGTLLGPRPVRPPTFVIRHRPAHSLGTTGRPSTRR